MKTQMTKKMYVVYFFVFIVPNTISYRVENILAGIGTLPKGVREVARVAWSPISSPFSIKPKKMGMKDRGILLLQNLRNIVSVKLLAFYLIFKFIKEFILK